MIILHGCVVSEQFHLWGETPPAKPESKPAKSRQVKEPRLKPWPFAAPADQLSSALPNRSPARPAVHAQQVVVWLPIASGRPIPSSPLIADWPDGPEQPKLVPWTVPALTLSPGEALDLLARCRDRETLAPGVIVGATLSYWAAALRLAGALAAREQFLPHLERRGTAWRGCWKPILGLEQEHLAQLAQAMPGACRAANGEAQLPEQPASVVLLEFLASMVDELVRDSNGTVARTVPAPGKRKARPGFDSLHDQWLHALWSVDGEMHGEEPELAALAAQVESWQRPLTVSSAAPFRLCFRLEEPKSNGNGSGESANGSAHGSWTLRYLLQARNDPSLLIPAVQAWNPGRRTAAVLRHGNFEPREYLLSSLGQAAGLCPPVEASLKRPAPSEFEVDTTEAFRFLAESSLLLEQAGFGVLLPAWWTRKGTKQRLTVTAQVKSPKLKGSSRLSLEELVQFDWQVALGDQPLTLQELETLARLKQPLVQVRGQWVQVKAEEIQAALDFWKQKEAGQATIRQVIQMALGQAEPPGGLAFAGVQATGWVDKLLKQLEGQKSFEELPPPSGFQGRLRPYQVRGYSWLAFLRRWGLGACLADDMGLGKTIQTLALIQRDWDAGDRRPALLVCPTSVMGNWKKEAERFTPDLPVLVHHGVQRSRDKTFVKSAAQQALVISSYALLHRDLKHFQQVGWGGVILDEAQNIKNPETKQAQAARSLSGEFRIALTGTPVENHVGDLWSISEFLNSGFLGNQSEFRRRFFIPIQAQRDSEAAGRLKRLTGPFILRRLKTDKRVIADLPDKLEMKVYCNLTKEQASLYAAVVAELDKSLEDVEGIQRKGVILATLSKLKQVCNHPAHFLGDNSPIPDRSGKLARLGEMLEELLEAGDRALIFTQFTEMGAIIRNHLQETFGREVLFLHGGVTPKQRDRMVARFQGESGPRLFLLSLKAGGTGLNLTAANHVFHFDRWWNPAVEDQATDRAFRIGQKRNVQVHKFLCVGTLEEKIDEMIERKKEVAGRVVGAGEGWLTELSNRQLKDLVALRQDALGE